MFSKINNATLTLNEPLKHHSTLKIGGDAKYFACAKTIDALLDVLYTCKQHSLPHKIIGNGSNMLFDDLGYNGAIIQYNDNFKKIKDNKLYASSGANLSELIQYSTQHNLGGLDFAIGVPAQLGGAIVNNLGAYNHEISTYIEHITVLRNKQIVYLTKNDCDFNYHSSIFQHNNDIVLSAIFNLPTQDKSATQAKMVEYIAKRRSTQPLDLSNAGSVFKRKGSIIPAKLIDDAGLKGLQVGDAQVSTKHAGFIVNLGSATSNDVLQLISLIKQKIYDKYLIKLELEIEYLPFI
ncbi:MAG: UDP-N-acetylmuramate dehydrogenase [Clostridia bacterium]|nr:UDP-N-acetylmuramate dehydrogenase [Clostridia bacterium]